MSTPIDYLLHLADNAVVLGQRNAEWCGHGPILEEDLALANVSLDLIGQARLLYQRVAELKGGDATEDKLAYFRDAHEFRNYTLLELPHHGPLVGYAAADRDYATTIVRNFLYSALMVLVWDGCRTRRRRPGGHRRQVGQGGQLPPAPRPRLAGAPGRRHRRIPRPRAGGGGSPDALHRGVLDHQPGRRRRGGRPRGVDVGPAPGLGRMVNDALAEATLSRPNFHGYVTEGKVGLHSEHLGFLLAEMQSLARAHPRPLVTMTMSQEVVPLEALTDPEIPVVTLRELGILRSATTARTASRWSSRPPTAAARRWARSRTTCAPGSPSWAWRRGSSPACRRPGPPTG
jgi:ring-1,2-phenylacetyl-CoA epoxidase subunit PaaC